MDTSADRSSSGQPSWAVQAGAGPSRPVSGWWFLAPIAAAILVLCVGYVFGGPLPRAASRQASPAAGPAEIVVLNAQPDIEYWIFHRAAAAEVGRDCGFDPTIGGGSATGWYLGSGYRLDLLDNPPASVTHGGRPYGYAGAVSSEVGGPVAISGAGGPVLVEVASPSWISPITVGLTSVFGLTLLAEGVIAVHRRRSARRARVG